MTGPDLLEVGRIDRSHGVRGDVLVTLISNRVDRLAPGSTLFADGVKLEVASSRPHSHRHIVHFVGVADRSGADQLRGALLTAPPLDDADELWIHHLIGSIVVDQDGIRRGTVVSVEANPASDLLVLDDETLVPLTFLVEAGDGTIAVDVPIGLFEQQAD